MERRHDAAGLWPDQRLTFGWDEAGLRCGRCGEARLRVHGHEEVPGRGTADRHSRCPGIPGPW